MFIAEVNSARTNLSPFTKGYRGLASRMQFVYNLCRESPLGAPPHHHHQATYCFCVFPLFVQLLNLTRSMARHLEQIVRTIPSEWPNPSALSPLILCCLGRPGSIHNHASISALSPYGVVKQQQQQQQSVYYLEGGHSVTSIAQ